MSIRYKKIISMLAAMAMAASMVSAFAADNVTTDANNDDIVIKAEDIVLVKDVDYTLEYKDNVNVGTATVIVHFIGNYSGEREQTFNITKKTSGGGGGGGGGSSNLPKSTPSPTPDPTTEPTPEATIMPTEEPEGYEHNSYISGYGDGKFIPDGNITRAETASMLYGVLETSDETADFTFPDLEDGAWYIPAIKAMTVTGIIKGYTDGTFKPDKHITRAEFVAMLMRAENVQSFVELPFSDVSADLWSADCIYSAYKAGYIDGYEDGTFKPDSPITRAEAVKIIDGFLGRTDFSNETNPFNDVSSAHWAYKYILEAAVKHRVN
ncbi:MAG: S-layer homology domain-containing protein [Oscillospiraceae bacterium]|nr:S-layer homology domain-containing protein [Oscillospiraceae bacterium]